LAAFIKACLSLYHTAQSADSRRRARVSVAGPDGNWVCVLVDQWTGPAPEGKHRCKDVVSGQTIRIPVHHKPASMTRATQSPLQTAPPDLFQEHGPDRLIPSAPQPLVTAVIDTHSEVARAHEAFLRFVTANRRQTITLLDRQTRLLEAYVRAEDQPSPAIPLAFRADEPHVADAQPSAVTP